MAIYQTGGYRVKQSAVEKVKEGIKDFVSLRKGERAGHPDVSGMAAEG